MTNNSYNPSMRLNPQLVIAAKLVESIVPDYDIRQSDPIKAAAEGMGNCVSKAVIGGILLERAMLLGHEAALAFNSHTHPKIGDDMFGRTRILNGHAQLLASTTNAPHIISALSFNPDGVDSLNWQVFDFNDDGETYAEVVDNHIKATENGIAVGFVINDWHTGGKYYYEALGQNNSTFHTYSAEEMTEQIVNSLKHRDLLLDIQ